MKCSVLLHNIRSAHNVGSIFRTADSAGFHKVYLSGYTPLPIDRFGRNREDIKKVALGAENSIQWESIDNFNDLLEKNDTYIISVEQDPRSIPYDVFDGAKLDKKYCEIILVLGEETKGIEMEILDASDIILEIPMKGSKKSLNVSVAFGIVAYGTKK